MTEAEHIALTPSKKALSSAKKKNKPEASRKGEPEFIMTEEMRRLSTPWSVASIRAGQIEPMSLPAGVVLDAAAGSGVQLIAYSKRLKRPALGIELNEDIAKICAANMELNSEGAVQRSLDRVLVGDGRDADSAISAYWTSLREAGTRAHPPIGMLHLDPARPQDAQNHSIDEMQPDIKNVLKAWSTHLQTGPRGPAILLTWEWLSRGGGRVDRLSVWIGSLSSTNSRRCLRIGRKKIIASIEGEDSAANPISFESAMDVPRGAWVSIVDPSLFQSGLQGTWIRMAVRKGTGSSWVRTEGRRPLLIHTEPLSEDDDVQGFVVATGEIVQHRLRPPEIHTIDQVASSISKKGIGKVTLRCSLDPDIHPTLQRRLDREMKGVEGSRGFMVDMEVARPSGPQTIFLVCKE